MKNTFFYCSFKSSDLEMVPFSQNNSLLFFTKAREKILSVTKKECYNEENNDQAKKNSSCDL